jgi:hypothetical protein
MGQLLITLLLGAFASDWALAETGEARRLRITIYADADIPAVAITNAPDTLRPIFGHSEINPEWIVADLAADEATLVVNSNIVSPAQERVLACRARRDIAVRIRRAAPSSVPSGVLGLAQPFASKGLNVQIYYERITAVAAARGLPPAAVLAYAIAHEIGHVLLRSSTHHASGLMSGVWGAREYGWISAGGLFFVRDESTKMRSTIDGSDGCSRTAPDAPLAVLQLPLR